MVRLTIYTIINYVRCCVTPAAVLFVAAVDCKREYRRAVMNAAELCCLPAAVSFFSVFSELLAVWCFLVGDVIVPPIHTNKEES